MTQNEPPLETVFREFLAAYDQADPVAKARVASQLQDWAGQQVELSGFQKNVSPPGGSSDTAREEMRTLVEKESQLQQMAENIEQVVWIRDMRTGHILYVSPAFEKVWGLSCASLYANPLAIIESIHPEDRVQVLAAAPNHDRQIINQEYRILRPDGGLRWMLVRSFFIREETGPTYRLVYIAQDITAQKKVELALRRALDRTQEQFTLSRKMSLARKPEAVLKTLMSARELRPAQRAALLFFPNSEDGSIHGIESVTSWQASQFLNAWEQEAALYEEPALWRLFQSDKPILFSQVRQDSRLKNTIREFLLNGEIQSLAIFPLFALRNWIGVLLVYFQEEHNFDTIELRHVKTLVDQATITLYNLQLLEVEEDLRHEAERANQIKTQFLAMITHELRTPLTSIIGFTTTLLAEDVAWEPDEQRDFIRTIQQEADRLQELIDHLLDLSRLEAGMLPISPEPRSLEEIIDGTVSHLQALAKGHNLMVHLPASLPAVMVDEKRIAQVLVNLVQNAATYAPPGGDIILSAAERSGYVQVNVADQGPGILPADRKKVFEAFRRGTQEDNRPGKGAGLGLAICKRLVEAHGGRIWIKTKTTPGATISFTVPIASVPYRQGAIEKGE